MAVKVGSFTKSTNTSTPVSQAVTGVGFQPRALILFTGGTTGVDAWEQGVEASVGYAARNAAETITNGCAAFASQDDVADSNTASNASAKALRIIDADGTTLAECVVSSFDAGGFTLSWTANDANGYRIGYMALGGDLLTDAYVVGWTLGTSTGDQAVTGVGFQPDCVLHVAAAGVASLHVGAMTASDQWGCGILSRDAQTSGKTYRVARTDAVFHTMSTSGLVDGVNAYVSLDADGFTTNCSDGHASAYQVYSLCLKGGSYKVGNFTSPSSGSGAVTGVGFQPDGVLIPSTARDSGSGAVDAMLTVGGYDGTTNFSVLVVDDYNADPTNCGAYASTADAVQMNTNAGQTRAGYGPMSSLDADGFTVNWTDYTNNLLTYFAAATGSAGGGSALLMQQHHHAGMRGSL